MSDSFSEVSSRGFLDNIFASIKGVLVGVLLFFGSFVILWMNEGRTNWAEVAKTSVVAPADKADGANDGKLVSVSGALDSQEPVGDPEFIAPGPWIELRRRPEMFAWVEHKSSKTEKKLGGGSETTTTYDYRREWTSHPKSSGEFRHPKDHDNPPMKVQLKDFTASKATVGAWKVALAGATLPHGDPLAPSTATLVSAPGTRVDGNYLFQGTGTAQSPNIGDVRISFTALPRGVQITFFARASQGALEAYQHEGTPFFRALKGGRDQAIQTLQTEHEMIGWILRLVGFLCMWIGMTLVLDPIATVMDVIPALGSLGRAAIGIVTFPIALVISAVTIVVSMILHSLVATVVVGLLALVVVALVLRKRKKAA